MNDDQTYFESHITIEPVFDDRLLGAQIIAKKYGFKVANLLMQKRKDDTPERSKNDTFMTGHSKTFSEMVTRMIDCTKHLQECQYKVHRYKIEDILVDSRTSDTFKLLT